jgi:zinc transporter 7
MICFISAFASTGLISLAPNLLLLLFPDLTAETDLHGNVILSLGQALAAGALLGDVFLHSLPHMYEDITFESSENRDGHESSNQLGLIVLLGFTAFYIMDTVVRFLSPDESHRHGGGGHHHEATRGNSPSSGLSEKDGEESGTRKELLSATVILNLAADALHNFTDGLAIGATYATSCDLSFGQDDSSFIMVLKTIFQTRGGVASMSVMMHEIPHELGDYAILVKHGYTKYEAVALQFLTAIAAFCGTAVGMTAIDSQWMMPFTSGGFLYLAAVNILPELLDDAPQASTKINAILIRLLQIAFFVIGIAFMHQVALMEHNEHGHGSSHDHHHTHHHEETHLHDEH